MIHQMTSLEEKVWSHVFALSYHLFSKAAATNREDDARDAEQEADAAIVNLRKLHEKDDQTTITIG